ncbi:hypothetical protein EPUS_06780 [Endocarpon pusillum Z07020]|uniref:Polyketide synthase-like phosphopantetheine-binding domain-containing protein n=1 Tax=Endocarpon pusillum (strain Z07020 / HMAS-L-300199) TaxID=1263415 RepID=U1HHM8_ENDPU|nr:uncharacterized protein EPUS_06780 [Endocarpon pusillum Z07020]ERF68364.1 hypothetical protein EPUS_06780 [Endocarpon pusillum Z07020]
MADNYFVCTLGQAANFPKTKARSIADFLELQAEKYGQRSAVGFPSLTENSASLLTFHELNDQTKQAARGLVRKIPKLKESLGQGRTTALLAHSHVVFLKSWLGLIRLGFSVLLLAPQLDKASIQHLCRERDVEYLFHDAYHAQRAAEVDGLILVHLGPHDLLHGAKENPEVEMQIGPHGKVCSIPYLHHSSGTSSGKPKAIAQTNAAAFAALPLIDTSPGVATFSSTPLYHGGVADCFRAWTSGQMIWLFPGGEKPITAQTVLVCLSLAGEAASNGSADTVKYFSSVPYVLRDLAADEKGIETLRRMDIVGVGGAAFPTTLGQKLVSEGVRLVSRYGSAECGFLLSSYRDFEKDEDWDYLRSDTGAERLSFEPQDNGLVELVVKAGWPHMAKTNRADSSYATADLLEKHPTKLNAWRYHSRADAQINLINGKKFDPEPLESAIVSKCESHLILDVLIFGEGENYPGALIFVRKCADQNPENILDQLWPTIEEVNHHNPSHARLSKGMIKLIFHESETVPALEKSSKGTILRGKAHQRYHGQIRQVYDGQATDPDLGYSIHKKSDLVAAIARLVERTTNRSLAHDEDFFEHGIDSVACIQIRQAIQNMLTGSQQRVKDKPQQARSGGVGNTKSDLFGTSFWSQHAGELPSNLLYDCGTIEAVASFLLGEEVSIEDNDFVLMKELVQKYSKLDVPQVIADTSSSTTGNGLVILLTGATGSLGTHLLDVLRCRPDVERIYCLLRASDPSVAYERVDKALKSKAKEGLQPVGTIDKKIICIPCNLARPDLGMDEDILRSIRSSVDMIIHAAWAVNFTLRLKSFEFHLAGVQNLLSLGSAAAPSTRASSSDRGHQKRRIKFLFCSSIASISSSSSVSVAEKVSREPQDASPMGYSRSKWVAEAVCVNAHKAAQAAGIPLDVEILRIGQLCGDTKHGIWNKTEAWPLLLSTFDLIGCLPDLPDEQLNWLPLNIAANVICEIAYSGRPVEDSPRDPPVYHILNPHSDPSWTEMLQWLQQVEDGRLHIVEPAAWLRSLKKCLIAGYQGHPSCKLLGLWKDAYQSKGKNADLKHHFEIKRAANASDTMSSVGPISEVLVGKMWTWTRKSIRAETSGEVDS